MKRMHHYLLVFAMLIGFYNHSHAQTSPQSRIHITDLNPGLQPDAAVSQEEKVKYFVNFKIEDASQADSVFFYFGTTAGGAEVVKEAGNFQKNGTAYSVKTQGPSYPIINTEVSCRIKITKKQFENAKFLSVVVKDKTGLYSNVLKMRIK